MRSGTARANEGSHSLTGQPTFIDKLNEPYTCLYSHCSRTASPHFGRYSFLVQLRVGG